MRCFIWKFGMLALALGMLLALGAFAEGTLSLAGAAALAAALGCGVRGCWAQAEAAERRDAARRAAARREGRAERAQRPPLRAA